MAERRLAGVAASPGTAIGAVRRWVAESGASEAALGESTPVEAATAAIDALHIAAQELSHLAEQRRAALDPDTADILDAGALMAEDPALHDLVRAAVIERGVSPAAAIRGELEATAAHLETLEDRDLAARAADVRSLARRAARIATGVGARVPSTGLDSVIVAPDLGPADVIELNGDVRALALAAGGVTGHAAIVARGLGLPMVVGLGPELMSLAEGTQLVVDGEHGVVIASPRPEDAAMARNAVARAREARHRSAAQRDIPTVTRDGRNVRVLTNASSPAEVREALRAGADGVGLLRTELAFLDATHWPSVDEHLRELVPLLSQLADRTATVRVLDFGGDKTPPFLRGAAGRGIELLLQAPDALTAQLRAIIEAGKDTDLRMLVPMVTDAAQLRAVRGLLEAASPAGGDRSSPPLGAMIEVPAAAAMVDRIAAEARLLSIGTNDLTSLQMGVERGRPGAAPHHPAVLRLIAAIVDAGRRAHVAVEVCGEAASDPLVMPLLVGLGIDELSVGAAAVASVRAWVRAVDYDAASAIARRALEADTAEEVRDLARPLRELLDHPG